MSTLGTKRIKRVILYGQLFVLLSAFASIYWQIHGLFGERGLLPVAPMLECEEESVFQCRLPLLRLICNVLHFSPAVGLQFLCILGIMISGYAIFNPRAQNIIVFLTLYFIYRTFYEAGGVFMYYQWDHLLLESTVHVAILAWFEDGPADSIAMYSIVVLLVRVTFMSGVTKLLSKCPKWWDLTALHYHFESQPLPTPLAWYAHHFPPFFKQLATLLTEYNEIILPAFFLIPLIQVRYFMFFCQVLLMTLTVFTGNYGFFNYNVLVLLVSLLETPRIPVGASFLSVIVFGKLGHDIFNRLPWALINEDGVQKLELTTNIIFFRKFLTYHIDIVIFCSIGAYLLVVGYSFLKGLVFPMKLRKFVHLIFVILTSTLLILYGMVPLLRLDEKLAERVSESPNIMQYYKTANGWGVANSYGSYRQMDGVYGRPEIIIEGANKIEGPWQEIQFYAKPGNVSKSPMFMAPHQPRLDWQMHYAADGTYQQNPFFLSLVYHLMQNTTEVVNLISHYPFKNRSEPMNFVRANVYMYHFTDIGEDGWWRRDFQEEYMPTFNKGNDALLKYLQEHKIINKNKSEFVNGPLGKVLKQGHRMTSGTEHFALVVTIFFTIVALKLHRNYYDPQNAHQDAN